jgi:para-aminobenzoate synthetase/4-amino-4-deoxychorismate lyase
MGLFEGATRMSRSEVGDWLSARGGRGYSLSELSLSMDERHYLKAFDVVKEYIAAGDVYQINLTLKYNFRFSGNSIDLYEELRRKQQVHYGAIVSGEDFTVLSLSPELFIRIEDGLVRARPMKGTAARGRSNAEDEVIAGWLREDPKSRAENLMIVDLLRNDLGRSALIGSVRVTDLFTVERYPTVFQMTSGISAKLHPGVGLRALIAGLYPCGSVTGAPKVRAMEIIRELESEPRGVYTGAIGMIAPSGDAAFNVAIRSLWLGADGAGEMGIGSGVVFDSDGRAEYRECLLKAEFLMRPYEPFQLIETLRWKKGAYYLLERHLDRLRESAHFFMFRFDREAVQDALQKAAAGFEADCCRVRLLLDMDGQTSVTAAPLHLPEKNSRFRFVISEKRTDSRDPFFYHKTTKRSLYDREHARLHAETGCDEVLFMNERGELAEGSRTSLFLQRDGELLTPPIEAGILDGVLRRELLESETRRVGEATLLPDDLEKAEAVYLGNSVRGLLKAEPIESV